jgi:UDP-GlcNAc:undecaprenyl-phosphate GlcNAc-1-phosphate transferase
MIDNRVGMRVMDSLFATVTALLVSLAIIPVMIRLAPSLRLLDQPSARKIHLSPIPRVGGWGITLGALCSVLLWLPLGTTSLAFVTGALILLVAGAIDDSRDLPARAKLVLQIMAALPAVLHAGLSIETLPLFGLDLPLPTPLAMLLTVVGLVACINATNTSDGLDGLAAGETLLSLAGILYLAAVTGSAEQLLITAAAVGGLAGFLRYNTHPAAIFMGDSGSQFLGFVVGFLGLALVQPEYAGLTPWTLLLLIGLPAADLVVVAARRWLAGVSCFQADRTHIHHRLLALGFPHQESVVVIYALQASLVFFAIALHTSEGWKILLVYGLHMALIYGFLTLAEGSFRERHRLGRDRYSRRRAGPLLVWVPRVALEIMIPLVLIMFAALATEVPTDVGLLAAVLVLPLVFWLFSHKAPPTFIARLPVFMIAAAVLYLYTDHRPFISAVSRVTEFGGMAAVAAVTALTLRYSPKRRRREFHTTAMDYLLVMVTLIAFFALQGLPLFVNVAFLIYLPIVLYGCEIITVERRERWNWLPMATLSAALILAVRGLTP